MNLTALEQVLILFKHYAAHEQPLDAGGHRIKSFVTWVIGLECCKIIDHDISIRDADFLYFKRSSKQSDYATISRRIRDDMFKSSLVKDVYVALDNDNKTVDILPGSDEPWAKLEEKAAAANFPKSVQQATIDDANDVGEDHEVAMPGLYLHQPQHMEPSAVYLPEPTATQDVSVTMPAEIHPQPTVALHDHQSIQSGSFSQPALTSLTHYPHPSGALGISSTADVPSSHLAMEELFADARPISRASSMGPPDIFGDLDFTLCAEPHSFSAPLPRSPVRNNSMPIINFHRETGVDSRKRPREESVSIHPPYAADSNESQRPFNFGDSDKNAFESAIQAACEAFKTAQGAADTQVAQLSGENVKLATDLKYAKLEFEKQKIDLVAQARVALEHQKRAEQTLEQEKRNVSRLEREKKEMGERCQQTEGLLNIKDNEIATLRKEMGERCQQTEGLLNIKDNEIATLRKEMEDARAEANELRTKGQQMLQSALAASSIFGNSANCRRILALKTHLY